MATWVRVVLGGVVVLGAVLVAIAIGVVLSVDVNRFKPAIVQVAQDQGIWIQLNGELSWSLLPPIRVVATNVEVDWTPDAASPLVSAQRVELGVRLMPLLSRQPTLEVDLVEIEGLRLALERDASGRGNWERASDPTVQTTAGESFELPPRPLDRIAIDDGYVRYVDYRANETITIRDLGFEATDVAFGNAFPAEIHLDFTVEEQGTRVLMDMVAETTLDASLSNVALDDLSITGELVRRDQRAVRYRLRGRVSHDAQRGRGALVLHRSRFGAMRFELSGDATNLNDVPRLVGHLDADVRDAVELVEELGIDEIPIERLALETDFDIEGRRIALSNARFTVDDGLLQGALRLSDDEVPELTFDLEADTLSLDQILQSPETWMRPAEPEAETADVVFFEREMISGLHWNGRVGAGRLISGGVALDDVRLTTGHREAIVNNTLDVGAVMKGSAAVTLDLDATAEPSWSAQWRMQGLDAQAVLDWIGFDTMVDGRITVEGSLAARGNTQRALAKSLNGEISLDGGRGTIDASEIKEIAMSVASLAGRKKKVEQWPDVIDYSRMTGSIRLDGIDNQQFAFTLDNFEVTGKGSYDFRRDAVDYKASFVFRDRPEYHSFPVPDIFVGVGFPIRCKGHLDADPLCSVTKDAAGRIIAQLLTKQVGRQLFKGIQGVITAPAKLVKPSEKKTGEQTGEETGEQAEPQIDQ
jgi:AsmA protein